MDGVASLNYDYNALADRRDLSLGWFNRFFRDVITGNIKCNYAVFLPRRCFNLLRLAENKFPEQMRVNEDSPKILSSIGWLPYAKTYAEHYLEKGYFPRTILIDDMAVYGRTIQSIVENFLSLISYFLHDERNWLNEADLCRDYTDSIQIVTFAKNDMPLLMTADVEKKLSYFLLCKKSRWHMFSAEIAEYVKNELISYTSYIISATIEKQEIPELVNWEKLTIPFSNLLKGGVCYILNETVGIKENEIKPATLAYVRVAKESPNQMMLAPFFVHGATHDIPQMIHAVGLLGKKYKIDGLKALADSYSNSMPCALIECYCMAADMLISQICLRLFLKDCFQQKNADSFVYDADKIRRSYSYWLTETDMLKITSTDWTVDDYQILSHAYHADPILPDDMGGKEVEGKLWQVINRVETAAAGLSLDSEMTVLAEKQKSIRYKKNIAYRVDPLSFEDQREYDRRSSSKLADFLRKCLTFRDKNGEDCYYRYPLRSLIPILFCLMDDDYAALRVGVERDNGNPVANIKVRHTELSSSLYMKKLKPFWRAFETLMFYYERNDSCFSKDIDHFLLAIEQNKNIRQECEKQGYDLSLACMDMRNITELIHENHELFASIMLWENDMPDELKPLENLILSKVF